ncbi:MAG TPA: hypothetical protein VFE16_11505 [Candidatus Cybelea sp.]|nr:hypothetical protein [Candidatus Cybelea sp.]
MTRREVGKGTAYPANVLAGDGVVYIVAGWGKAHPYEGFATIPMSGKVMHAPRQPKCSYSGSPGAYDMYALDIALNSEERSVFMNPNVTFSLRKEFGWTFVSPASGKSECHIADVSAGNLSVLTIGPQDTIWGAGAASPYLWRFSADGSAANFALPKGVTAFDSLVEGPDHVIWAQPENTQLVMRISPGSGRVLNRFKVPCPRPAHALAVVSGFVWGYADACVFAILPSGVANAYSVTGLVAEDSPHAIAAGPDGNPWFIQRAPGSAAAIATLDRDSKKATFVALPSGASDALALGTGPDRNLWVTDANDDLYTYVPNPLSVDPPSVTIPQVRDVARLTVTEHGTSRWRASSANTSVARIRKTSTPDVFAVTATGSGKTKLTIEDTVGNSVVVPVTVF